MTGIVLLDAAIGVFFALLVYSLAATTIQEAIANLLNLRGRMLRAGIGRFANGKLGDQGIGQKIMAQEPIEALHGPGFWLTRWLSGDHEELGRVPSTIPSASFAKALLQTVVSAYREVAANGGPATAAAANARALLQTVSIDDSLRNDLVAYVEKAETASGSLGTVDDALKRAREHVGALGLTPADQEKVDAVLDRITGSTGTLKESIPAALQALKDGLRSGDLEDALKQHVIDVIDHVEAGIQTARAELVATVEGLEREIAQRFDTAMERVIGWYVRQTKLILFAIGFSLAAFTNFDVIGYSANLLEDDKLRAEIVAQAEMMTASAKLVKEGEAKPEDLDEALKQLNAATMKSVQQINEQLGAKGVRLGWPCKAEGDDDPAPGFCACISRNVTASGLLSWLLIAFACTMGGQFWYDALKKLMSMRGAMAAPAPKGGEKGAAAS